MIGPPPIPAEFAKADTRNISKYPIISYLLIGKTSLCCIMAVIVFKARFSESMSEEARA